MYFMAGSVMRFPKPSLMCGAFALVGLVSGHVAAAQAPAPAGWETSRSPDGLFGLTHPTGEAIIVERLGVAPGELESVLAGFEALKPCPGLPGARVVAAPAGAGQMRDSVSGGIACRMIWGKQMDGRFAVSVSMEAEDGALGARTLQGSRMAGYVVPPASAATATLSRTQASASLARATGAAPDDAALKAALAKVPTQSRPVDVVMRGGSRIDGTILNTWYEPMLILPNGLATYCPKWDPLRVAATVNAFAQVGLQCELLPWRRSGAAYQIKGSDGVWGDPEPGVRNKGAKPGRRMALTLMSTEAMSTLGFAGTRGVAVITEGSLAMTADGAIQMGSEQFTWRYRHTDYASDGPLIGRYYLDGFLIAIGDDQGQTSVTSFIDLTDGEETYVYLGDTFYFSQDP